MIKKSDKQDDVLNIVEGIVEEWQDTMTQINMGGGVFAPAMQNLETKIGRARKKITNLIPKREERISTVEQSLLASLNDKDFFESLPNLFKLTTLANKDVVPSNFPEFLTKVKSKRGMKNSSIFPDTSIKSQNKRRLKGPSVDRVNTYQMPYMMRSGRNYGEYCTDFIEQNALELYMLGRLDEDMGEGVSRLKKRIEDRNPHTKIFEQGIVKLASKQIDNFDDEEIINATVRDKINLLRERRDYGIPKKKRKKK